MTFLSLLFSGLILFMSGNPADKPHYECYKTEGEIKIDGLINEGDWDNAPEGVFIDMDGSEPRQKTTFKWLWDDKYLYGAFYVEDDHIWAKMTERDAYLWHENVVEFFINAVPLGRKAVSAAR